MICHMVSAAKAALFMLASTLEAAAVPAEISTL